MSAFIVTEKTIDTICKYTDDHKLLEYENIAADLTELGNILWKENVRSVNYRYKEKNKIPAYYYTPSKVGAYTLTTVEFLKQLRCLNYQSCERPDWEKTKAWKIIRTLAFSAVHHLEGYDEAPWGL